MKTQIVLSGVGGQGLISTGEIIGEAASIHANLFATLSSSYGSETRGTFTKSDVIISDVPVNFPNIDKPDIILCLAQVAYDRYADKFMDHTKVFYDSGSVRPAAHARGEHIGYPFGKMALEMGNAAVANTIALGVILKRCGILTREQAAAGIKEYFLSKPKVIGINIDALDKGLELG